MTHCCWSTCWVFKQRNHLQQPAVERPARSYKCCEYPKIDLIVTGFARFALVGSLLSGQWKSTIVDAAGRRVNTIDTMQDSKVLQLLHSQGWSVLQLWELITWYAHHLSEKMGWKGCAESTSDWGIEPYCWGGKTHAPTACWLRGCFYFIRASFFSKRFHWKKQNHQKISSWLREKFSILLRNFSVLTTKELGTYSVLFVLRFFLTFLLFPRLCQLDGPGKHLTGPWCFTTTELFRHKRTSLPRVEQCRGKPTKTLRVVSPCKTLWPTGWPDFSLCFRQGCW